MVSSETYDHRKLELTLRPDFTYRWALIVEGLRPSTFQGTWHRSGDRIVFDTVTRPVPIVLQSDHTAGTVQGRRHVITVHLDLAKAMLDNIGFQVTVKFADGRSSIMNFARKHGGIQAAIPPDLGAVRSFTIDGKERNGGGHYVVQVPYARRDATDFSLLFSRNAIDYQNAAPMPPLTIEGDHLRMDHGLIFVSDGDR